MPKIVYYLQLQPMINTFHDPNNLIHRSIIEVFGHHLVYNNDPIVPKIIDEILLNNYKIY